MESPPCSLTRRKVQLSSDLKDCQLYAKQHKFSSLEDNPFQNLENEISQEQLETWEKMNEQVRGLVQMSDDDEDVETMIDDSLLVTHVAKESFDLAEKPGPSQMDSGIERPPEVSYFTAPQMDLTLQYLSGKITFLEFSEQMDMETNIEEQAADDTKNVVYVHLINMGDEQQVKEEPDQQVIVEMNQKSEKKVEKKERKKRKKRSDLPKYLESSMGEASMTLALGKHEEAIQKCMEIVRQAPDASKPFQTLGMIYDDMGDVQKSLQYFLIAAYLDPWDCEEWARLADICLEQSDVNQAIKCYSRAISVGGKNKIDCLWERSRLYENIKEYKKALEGYQAILTLLPSSDSEKYFKLAWGITRSYYELGEKSGAIDTITRAFRDHPGQITSDDVNLLLELQIPEKHYLECLQVFVEHCGVTFTFGNSKLWLRDSGLSLEDIKDKIAISCTVPDMLAIDLRIKLAVCMIHVQFIGIVQQVISPLLDEDIEVYGDLYLDLAEAFMESGHYKQAEQLLKMLVKTQNYNLAAVWLRYGQCLNILGDVHGAVQAYAKVVELAPTHIGARMSLSALQQQLGKHVEALEALTHEEMEERQLTREEQQMLLQKCHLLNVQGKLDEFLITAKQLLFQEWRELEAENMSYLQAITTYRHRKESLMTHLQSKGKAKEFKKIVPHLSFKNREPSAISMQEMWDMFSELCGSLLAAKRYTEFEDISLLGMLNPLFSDDQNLNTEFQWLLLTAAILSKNTIRAYTYGRLLVLENCSSTHAWNIFCQVIMVCNDSRHNRFCLRRMMHDPHSIPLGIMNGHISMSTGSYKHSLGEYAHVFKRNPTDPLLSLCIGLDLIHIGSQRFAAKRQYLITQGLTFLNNYVELRGPCQETFYNLGRALQQINVLHAAIHYYEKALAMEPCVGQQGGMFDLTYETAYNLSLIYQHAGSTEYAKYLLYKYCTL